MTVLWSLAIGIMLSASPLGACIDQNSSPSNNCSGAASNLCCSTTTSAKTAAECKKVDDLPVCNDGGNACVDDTDCCSGFCDGNLDSSGPNPPAGFCRVLPHWRNLYFSGDQICKVGGNACTSNADCCSGSCNQPAPPNPGTCDDAFKCVNKIPQGQDIVGVASCDTADVVIPEDIGSGVITTIQLIPNQFGTCVVPFNNGGPILPVAGQLADPSGTSTSIHGEQCQPIIADQDVTKFNVLQAYLNGFMFVGGTNNYPDDSGTNGRAKSAANKLLTKYGTAQYEYRQAKENFMTALNQIAQSAATAGGSGCQDDVATTINECNAIGDTMASEILKIMADIVDSLGDRDEKFMDAFTTATNDLINTTNHFNGISWSCKKWIDIEEGIYQPCFSSCSAGLIGHKNKDCKQCPGSVNNINGQAGVNRTLVNPLIPATLTTKIGDEANIRAAMETAFIDWGSNIVLNIGGNPTNIGSIGNFDVHSNEQEFNPGMSRGYDLQQMSILAYQFYIDYARSGGCSRPAAQKANTLALVRDSSGWLVEFYKKSYQLRRLQAQCLRNVAAMRESGATGATTLENIAATQYINDTNNNTQSVDDVAASLANNPSLQEQTTGTFDLSIDSIGASGIEANNGSNLNTGNNLGAGNLGSGTTNANAAIRSLNDVIKSENDAVFKALGNKQGQLQIDKLQKFSTAGLNLINATKSAAARSSALAADAADPKDLESLKNSNSSSVSKLVNDGNNTIEGSLGGEFDVSALGFGAAATRAAQAKSKSGLSSNQLDNDSQIVGNHAASPEELTGLSRSELDQIMNKVRDSKFNQYDKDSLFQKISKTYVRHGYPRLLTKKRKPAATDQAEEVDIPEYETINRLEIEKARKSPAK